MHIKIECLYIESDLDSMLVDIFFRNDLMNIYNFYTIYSCSTPICELILTGKFIYNIRASYILWGYYHTSTCIIVPSTYFKQLLYMIHQTIVYSPFSRKWIHCIHVDTYKEGLILLEELIKLVTFNLIFLILIFNSI